MRRKRQASTSKCKQKELRILIMFQKEKFDIIIQAGQSNAEGGGSGPIETEYKPCERVLYLTAKRKSEVIDELLVVTYEQVPFEISIAAERQEPEGLRNDFSLSFAKEYVDNGYLAEDRKLLIIRAAVGGAGFLKGHWGLGKQLYNKLVEMVDYALSLNPENRIVGFLWHQGEHDAFEGNPPENFYKALKEMCFDVRARYGNMPFIAGDFCPEWRNKNIEICQPIIDKIKQVVSELGNSGFVESVGLLSNNQRTGNGDDIHFCRESLYELGRRYFSTYQTLTKGF